MFYPSLCLENTIFIGGRNRFRTVHSSANRNWEPSQHVRTRSAKTGDAVPSGERALVGRMELGWSVPCGSLLPAPSQAQRGPDPAHTPSPASI